MKLWSSESARARRSGWSSITDWPRAVGAAFVGTVARHRAIWFAGAMVALVHATNMTGYPYYENDEGTYLSQAWSVLHLGRLTPYTYWYDHPPLGWIQIGPPVEFLKVFSPTYLGAGRFVMLLLAVASAVLVYMLANRLSGSRVAALVATLIFGLSPFAVMFHRRILLDNIATFWVLVALVIALRRDKTLMSTWVSAAAMAVAVLSKEVVVFFFPAVLYAALLEVDRRRRRMFLSNWIGMFLIVGSLYPLYALLKGEFFPAGSVFGGQAPHVSLLGTLAFQAGRTGGCGDAINGVLDCVWQQDPLLMLGAAGGLGVALFRVWADPLARLVTLLVVPFLMFLLRGALVLDWYFVPLIPMVAISLAWAGWSVCGAIGHGLGRPLLARGGWGDFPDRLRRHDPLALPGRLMLSVRHRVAHRLVAGRRLRHASLSVALPLVVLALGVGPSGVAPSVGAFSAASSRALAELAATYGESYRTLLSEDATGPQLQALDWIRENLPAGSTIVVDNYLWVDLAADGVEHEAHYYWKVEKDPEVRTGVLADDWRSVDYVVATETLLFDVRTNEFPFLREILRHGRTVVSFRGEGSSVSIVEIVGDLDDRTPSEP